MEAKKIKIVSPNGYALTESRQEKCGGVSMTVPDDSYSIRELLEKYSRGMMPPVGKQGQFDPGADLDSDDLEKLPHQDLFEIQERREALGADMIDKERQLKEKAKADADKQKARAQEWDEIRQELKKKKQKTGPSRAQEKAPGGAVGMSEAE